MKFISLLFLFFTCILVAHEDPTDVIDTLTHKIEKLEIQDKLDLKKMSELHLNRGIEYLVMRKGDKARKDFIKAATLDPLNTVAWLKLAELETHLRLKFHYATDALMTAKNDFHRSSASFVVSECYYLNKQYTAALAFCGLAIQCDEGKGLPLLLFKSHLLFKLNALNQRVTFLRQAQKINPSIVLRNQYIDAMIDAGKGDKVRATIEKELADSRFKSSWYIRLARIDKKHRKQFVEAAFKEIKNRQNNKQPDLTLFMDLVRAYKLYGYDKRAQNTLNYLESHKLDPWQLAELKAFKE